MKHPLAREKEMNRGLSRKPSMRQGKYTYNLETRRQGQVGYSEHGGKTKHPLARNEETNGGLSV